ncbi:MAG: PIN domain-containing protein [Solirubrobacterales bacterium]
MPLTNSIALRPAELDAFGSEGPADCFIVATAIEHDLTLLTADRAMWAFEPVTTIW